MVKIVEVEEQLDGTVEVGRDEKLDEIEARLEVLFDERLLNREEEATICGMLLLLLLL